MSINMKKYVDIKSSVGATGGVKRRDLSLCIFSESASASPGAPTEFSNATSVMRVFGEDSAEYARAKEYFSYVGPNYTSPKKISFARDKTASSRPQVIGASANFDLDTLKAGASTMTIVVDGTNYTTALFTLEAATSLASVASLVQAEIQKLTKGGVLLTSSTFTYDAKQRRFVFTGGEYVAATVTITYNGRPDPGDSISSLLKVRGVNGAVSIAGLLDPEGTTASFTSAANASNNFGTFIFMRQLSLEEHIAICEANSQLDVMFEYVVAVTEANAEKWSAALQGYEGTTLVLVATNNTEFDEQIPGAIKAAVDYSKEDSVVGYMYRQIDGVTPKVTTDELSDTLDNLRVNYYGQTQQAGQQIAFYQRGVMMGGSDSPVDENVFANEQWLKDDLAAGFMELFLSVGRVSDNAAGKNKLTNTIQATLDAAVFNGAVSVGKELTTKQKAYIAQITGDQRAWAQIQNIGYWYTVGVEAYTTDDSRTEFKGVYTLLYSKDDTIRKVEGNNILI